MRQVYGSCCSEPWILDAPLLPLSDNEWRKCENGHRNTSDHRSPHTRVPRNDRLSEELPYRTSRDVELRQILAPPKVSVREQNVPIREDETSLSVGICSVVQGWRDNPRIECYDHYYRGENNRISENFGRPETVTCVHSPPFFFSTKQLLFLADICVGNPPKSFNQTHSITSVRLRNSLNPDDE